MESNMPVLTAVLGALALTSIPFGAGSLTVDFRGETIEVFTYKPRVIRHRGLLLVMHGTLRNASEYRDDAIAMAERFEMIVASPKFDSARFPSRRYQRGGILRADGNVAPEDERTYAFLPAIVAEINRLEHSRMEFSVIGHSAGGQFVVRCAAFASIGAKRLIAANAGSHVFPTADLPFGYGFGTLPESVADEASIRRYLAAPLTFFQGTADNVPDEYFDKSEPAMKQGPGRFQRGKACFEMGKALARSKGWTFGWKHVEASGIPHDHERMFNHMNCAEALFGERALKGYGEPLAAPR
jgi:pimeloyl-ACP methyl ester carboxylesterase